MSARQRRALQSRAVSVSRICWVRRAPVLSALLTLVALGCRHRSAPVVPPPAAPVVAKPSRPPIPTRAPLPALAAGETYAYDRGVARKLTIEAARAAGLLDVELGDDWAPYILQDGGGEADAAKPNDYRETFVALANDKLSSEGKQSTSAGDQNFLEVFGIPPTLSVLAARVEADVAPAREACYDAVDRQGLEQFTGEVGFLDRDRSKRDYEQAVHDADWIAKETVARSTGVSLTPELVLTQLREDPKARGRVDRYLRGKTRVRAVRAAQARLLCEGLLSPKSRYTPGSYDLPTHEALATWERKNDVFGWGFLGGETMGMLLAPSRSLLLDDLRRALAERVADAAGIVEDGSINQSRKRNPPTWRDAAGAPHPVPNLIDDHVNALLTAIGVQTPEQAIAFLRAHKAGLAGLHVAFKAPALPEYYGDGKNMDLTAEIDRGDIWYDLPFDGRGKPVVQRRDHYPHLTLFVRWHGQKIPLCWWRTTIGSWRSEMHEDGHEYFKYKNSEIGPPVWKQK